MVQTVIVNGDLARFFPYLPNWREGVSRTLEYKTDLFRSFLGTEQRRALRTRARVSYEYTLTAAEMESAKLRSVLAGWSRKLFLIPDPVRRVGSTGMVALANRIVLNVATPWAQAGRYVALQYRDQMECRYIDDVQGAELIFNSAGTKVWPPGTQVRPAYPARLIDTVGTRAFTSRVMEAPLEFSVEPTTPVYSPEGTPDATYNGLEVFLYPINWGTTPSVNFENTLDVEDFGYGPRSVLAPEDFSSRSQRMQFLARDLSEADRAEGFFHRMKGRRGSFYMPSHTHDLYVSEPVVQGSTQIVVALADVTALLDDAANRSLVLFDRQGNAYYNRIEEYQVSQGGYGLDYGLSYGQQEGYSEDEDQQVVTLTVAEPWSITLAPSDIRKASWLLCCRLSSDNLLFEHHTDTVSEFSLTITQIKDADPATRIIGGWGFDYGNAYGGYV